MTVSGYPYLTRSNTVNHQNTGEVVGTHRRGNDTVTVTFKFIKGALVKVRRSS